MTIVMTMVIFKSQVDYQTKKPIEPSTDESCFSSETPRQGCELGFGQDLGKTAAVAAAAFVQVDAGLDDGDHRVGGMDARQFARQTRR